MYLIVGLGNPEKEYSNTRHNMGFDVINKLGKKYGIDLMRNNFEGIYGTGIIEDNKVILLKPQTYMNLSGNSIIKFKEYYKIENEKIIVVFDDIDIEKGKIKIKKSGSPGTHNGIKSVVNSLKTQEFPRIKIGIGMPVENENLADYVTEKMNEEEINMLNDATDIAVESITEILINGIDKAMNKYN